MMDLSGRVAIVTGASRGIGRAIARQLAARGAHVIAAARGDHAQVVAEEIEAGGGKAEAAALDVTEAGAADAFVAATLERHGRIDILVNNAGIARDKLMLRMKREDWDAVLATNLTAAFAMTQAVLKPMIRQHGGRIVVHQLGRRPERERRPGQLRRVQGRPDRLCQGGGARGRLARHYGERGGAGTD